MSATQAAPSNADVPAEDKDDSVRALPLMDHAYDGIQEYDNPLPGWWKAIFVGSVVFAAMYGFYFHIANWGKTPAQTYMADLGDFNAKKVIRDQAEAANVNEEALARNALDSKLVEHGAEVFAAKCLACHAAEGRGNIGPNLTDSFQIHGSTRMNLFATVRDGVSGTAMIAWGEQLSASDILDVVAYVATLRGRNLEGGKAPQGQPVQAFQP